MPGARRPPEAGVVENAVAIGLFRSAAHALIQADPVPGAIGYWRSRNKRELDFVAPARSLGRGGRIPIEVKGDNQPAIGRARLAISKAFGEGIAASRTLFDPEGDVPVLPVPVLLAGLTEAPSRDRMRSAFASMRAPGSSAAWPTSCKKADRLEWPGSRIFRTLRPNPPAFGSVPCQCRE
jgi:hypothetical protein